MVGYDESDLARVLAGAPAQNQVVEAVVKFGYEYRDLRFFSRDGHFGFHPDGIAERLERFGGFIGLASLFVRPLDPLEEHARLGVAVLVGVYDVSAVVEDPS
jgi:hypothetical protein